MKTLLYIGIGESGSNFLQEKIFKKLKNTLYIDILNEYLLNVFYTDNFQLEKKKIGEDLYKLAENKENLIISYPHIAIPPVYDQYILCDRLHKSLKSPLILIILRNQFDFIRNYYIQQIAGGAYISFNKFIKYIFLNFQKEILAKLDYYNLCSYYVKKFGKENIKIILYEELFDKKKNFNTALFEKKLNLNIKDLNLAPEISNMIPAQLLFLRRCMNLVYRYDHGLGSYDLPTRSINEKYQFSFKLYYKLILNKIFKNKVVIKILKKKRIRINDELSDKIFHIYSKSNSKLESEFNLNLTSNNYPTKDNNGRLLKNHRYIRT